MGWRRGKRQFFPRSCTDNHCFAQRVPEDEETATEKALLCSWLYPLPHFPCHRAHVLKVSKVPSLQVRDKLAAGAVPLGKFVITKQLTRRPEEYPDAKSQPHVQVALRRRAQNRRDGTLQARRP